MAADRIGARKRRGREKDDGAAKMAGDETAVLVRAAPSGGARARHGTLRQRRGQRRQRRRRRRRRRPRRADESETHTGRRPFVSAVRVAVVDGDG